MLNSQNCPQWLDALLSETFFNPCILHEDLKKNEKKIFCLDCCDGICSHCLSDHCSHRLLQIRRYCYNDVLRETDAEKLIDCSQVQTFTNNNAQVMFLKPRPQTRKIRSGSCLCCDRAVQNPNVYCSLFCKLENILRTQGSLAKDHVFGFDGVTFSEPMLEEVLVTYDLEPAGLSQTESGSSGDGCVLASAASIDPVVRKKRSTTQQFRAARRPVMLPTAEISGRHRHFLRSQERLTKDHVFGFDGVTFSEPTLEEVLVTYDTVLEPAGSNQTKSGSSGDGCVLACAASIDPVVRKKRSTTQQFRAACRPVVLPTAEISGRCRKSAPHRAPLY